MGKEIKEMRKEIKQMIRMRDRIRNLTENSLKGMQERNDIFTGNGITDIRVGFEVQQG